MLAWLARFAAFWFLLDAFGVGGSVQNVLLVFGVNQVAGAVPFTYTADLGQYDEPTVSAMHPMQIPWVEPVDVSNAVLFLASEDARYITGISLPVDAGLLAR